MADTVSDPEHSMCRIRAAENEDDGSLYSAWGEIDTETHMRHYN